MVLPIAKAIVEVHGGSLSVISERGRGSVFSFTLPIGSQLISNPCKFPSEAETICETRCGTRGDCWEVCNAFTQVQRKYGQQPRGDSFARIPLSERDECSELVDFNGRTSLEAQMVDCVICRYWSDRLEEAEHTVSSKAQ
jgi:hypothetical protein